MTALWGADVPISMPDVPAYPSLVPMGGFGFGLGGLVPDIDAATREAIAVPYIAPRVHEDGPRAR